MQTLRALVYAAIFFPGTAMFVLAGLAASLVGMRPTRSLVRGWTSFHHQLARAVARVSVEVEGHIPDGAFLIAVKHQSMFETLETVRIAQTPVIVIKRELSRIPLFGLLTRRYGVIPVDRSAGPKALREMVAAGRDAIASERAILIFPEGTRVAWGESPPLRSGFAGLYRALGLAVVPVAVDSGRVWGKLLPERPGIIRFRIGETIPAGLKRDEVEARVHSAINALEA